MTPKIERALESVRGVYLRSAFVSGSLKAGAVLVTLALFLFVGDNLLALPGLVRLLFAVLFSLFFLFVLIKELFIPLFSDLSAETCALILEKRHPDFDCRLINTLLLSQQRLSPLSGKIVNVTTREVEHSLRKIEFPAFFQRGTVFKLLGAAGVAVLLFSCYTVFFPGWFGNAFSRYLHPFSVVPHLRGAAVTVTPGTITCGPDAGVTVRAVFEGALPREVVLKRDGTSFRMDFDGSAYCFTFPPVKASFQYQVASESAASSIYTVTVEQPPSVVGMRLRYDSPGYTGKAVRFEENASGAVSCLAGTKVTATITVDKAITGGTLACYGESSGLVLRGEKRAEGVFTVEGDGWYQFTVTGKENGLTGGGGRRYRIKAVPDGAPLVVFRSPEPHERYEMNKPLGVQLQARDDFGVAVVVLQIAETKTGPWRNAHMKEGEKGRCVLPAEVVLYPKKETLALRAVVRDFLGQESTTEPVELRALSPGQLREKLLNQLSHAVRSLRRILELQKTLLDRTTVVSRENQFPREKVYALRDEQAVIIRESGSLLEAWDATFLSADKRLLFSLLVKEEMQRVVSLFAASAASGGAEQKFTRAIEVQEGIIEELKKLIGALQERALSLRDGPVPGALQNHAERVARKKHQLAELRDTLEQFLAEQRDAISSSERLLGKRVDDFTDPEREKLKELQETEEKWAGVLKAKAAEYAKLGGQDFADGTLAEELIEAYSEVDLAADALERKNIEIAVPAEDAGAELAEEIKSNIERWLADVPDKIKWSMEDPLADVEVPMADLPEELEDLIGELIDDQEEMTEEVEDVTSGWLDSLDEGAGWTAMDGPISNMSAKGVTGNLLPNQHEIGGRSGEGRSGKSHGQMVENTATGKGGRPTPTRVTPDPFEAGQVKDTGKDPASGATGGGKLSGTAPEGLRGPASPDMGEKLRGLAQKQSSIRSRAERMERRLHRLHITRENLQRSVALMKTLETFLQSGRKGDIAHLNERIVTTLRNLETDAALKRGMQFDRTALPRTLAEGMENAGDEPVPEAYEKTVQDYFEALAGQRSK